MKQWVNKRINGKKRKMQDSKTDKTDNSLIFPWDKKKLVAATAKIKLALGLLR